MARAPEATIEDVYRRIVLIASWSTTSAATSVGKYSSLREGVATIIRASQTLRWLHTRSQWLSHAYIQPFSLLPNHSRQLPRNVAMSSNASTNNGNNPLSKLKSRFSKFSSGANDGLSSNDAGQAPAKTPDASSSSATSDAQAPSPKATAAPDISNVVLAATSTEPLPMPNAQTKPTKTSSAGAAAPASTASGPPPPPGKDDTPPSAAASAHLPNYSSSARSLQGEKTKLRHFYPQIEPYRTGRIKVGSQEDGGHELYWELSGTEGGYPSECLA